jgi:hypothetical protein
MLLTETGANKGCNEPDKQPPPLRIDLFYSEPSNHSEVDNLRQGATQVGSYK